MVRRKLTLFCVGLGALSFIARTGVAQERKGPEWTYNGSDGPDHWADLDKSFVTCKVGRHQSPIDIRNTKKSDLPVIQFDYQATPLHIVNNGHTIQINYAPGSFITVGEKRYELKQFHFHHPSEEKINGSGFAMVAHLVHADAGGNLAVVAVLLETSGVNQLIESLWNHVPPQPGPEQQYDEVPINVASLLPADHGYFSFSGSLTTPPCSENVTWFVLKTPTQISQDQADAFGKIYPRNARPPQGLNGREVLESK
jgi:carbonic anhydrase